MANTTLTDSMAALKMMLRLDASTDRLSDTFRELHAIGWVTDVPDLTYAGRDALERALFAAADELEYRSTGRIL